MDEVNIVEYDPRWQTLFAQEAERIWQVLGNDLVVEIEHIGSTAVPGMAAKPVIDIMVGVRSLVNAKSTVPILESLGYVYWRENPDPGRMFFCERNATIRKATYSSCSYSRGEERILGGA
ncbi:GrpB family protein [Nostoc sp. FACHB-888]|uniref:GrpB family protein n=1 Tax=Nostoc sp. FACHB-888 TaxID=2692842 RepID=UPI0018EF6D23|nr:GrpB family protein [Nostoc sp. FACHB-888]